MDSLGMYILEGLRVSGSFAMFKGNVVLSPPSLEQDYLRLFSLGSMPPELQQTLLLASTDDSAR